MVRLSMILPTTGRDSLPFAARAARVQMKDGDELLIVGGGALGEMASIWNQARWIDVPPGRNWGATERTHAIPLATGTHLLFIDDDDALVPGALDVIRDAVSDAPARPHIFQMIDPWGRVLPNGPHVREGNLGTPQMVSPNIPSKLGVWGTRYEGDFDFIASTLAHYPDGPVWHDVVTYACRRYGRKAWER
jgi:threonine dehydrogenase-like Zn-dependent dehydrogenase